jgi:agarase
VRIPYAEACQRKYRSQAAWRSVVAGRLATWGFNTLGAWSDETVATMGPVPLAVAPNLDLGMSFAWQRNEQANGEREQDFPDVFDPDFDSHIRRRARALCGGRREDQGIIGWFIDNDLRWGRLARPDELLTLFLNLSAASPSSPGCDLLRERHSTSRDQFILAPACNILGSILPASRAPPPQSVYQAQHARRERPIAPTVIARIRG